MLAMVLMLALTSVPGVTGDVIRAGSSPTPDSPVAALECMARAYSDKSVESLGALLSADFSYHLANQDSVARFVDGLSRDRELSAASAMFFGLKQDGRMILPPLDTILVTVGDTREGDDPEHPDSTRHYRLVSVRPLAFRMASASDTTVYREDPALHVFHLVRGDAAVRVAGQPGDSTRWYIRRWLENVDHLALSLGETKGECEEPKPRPVTPAIEESGPGASAPRALAIHPLGNPACPSLDVRCDLPGTEPALLEVFDVQGRRVARHPLAVKSPGTLKLEAGAGVSLAPGAYWLRLTQAGRRPSTAMVVVAR